MVKVSREKWGSKWRWVVRDRGQFVPKSVRKQVLRDKFTPKKYRYKYVEYTRTMLYRLDDDPGNYYTVDVVVTERVPLSFDNQDVMGRLVDPELMVKMRRFFLSSHRGVGHSHLLDVKDNRAYGGARWVLGPSDTFVSGLSKRPKGSGAYWRGKRFG